MKTVHDILQKSHDLWCEYARNLPPEKQNPSIQSIIFALDEIKDGTFTDRPERPLSLDHAHTVTLALLGNLGKNQFTPEEVNPTINLLSWMVGRAFNALKYSLATYLNNPATKDYAEQALALIPTAIQVGLQPIEEWQATTEQAMAAILAILEKPKDASKQGITWKMVTQAIDELRTWNENKERTVFGTPQETNLDLALQIKYNLAVVRCNDTEMHQIMAIEATERPALESHAVWFAILAYGVSIRSYRQIPQTTDSGNREEQLEDLISTHLLPYLNHSELEYFFTNPTFKKLILKLWEKNLEDMKSKIPSLLDTPEALASGALRAVRDSTPGVRVSDLPPAPSSGTSDIRVLDAVEADGHTALPALPPPMRPPSIPHTRPLHRPYPSVSPASPIRAHSPKPTAR